MQKVKSAVRVFLVLEYFDDVKEPRTLTEISRDLKMPMSSCIALLRSLESVDYMTFDPLTKKYLPSVRVQQLGSWLNDYIFASGNIKSIAEAVAKETGESTVIATMNGNEAQYILQVQTEHPLPYAPSIGVRRSLLNSSVGLVLLAPQSDDFIERMVLRVNSKAGKKGTRYTYESVMEEINQIRRDRYVYAANRIVEGAGMVAVAIPPLDGRPALALGVGAPINRLEHRIEEVVKIAQREIKKHV